MNRGPGLGLKDKVVIVTGAARGIGREYALGFAREGAKVVVCDILDCDETASAIEAQGAEVLTLKTDVTSEADTAAMASKTVERFGRIDVLVNNAGYYGGMKGMFFTERTVEEWQKMLNSHVIGAFLCTKAVFPIMKEQGGGKIVNISSGIVFNAFPGEDHYAAAKGAIFAFTRCQARGLGPYNINVNQVAPGLIMTQASADKVTDAMAEGWKQATSLKRMQKPDSPVGAALFLSSYLADDITGQTILVDCGNTMD